MNLVLRPYKPEDAKSFAEIHYDAVHNLAGEHYSKDVLDDWSYPIDGNRIQQIQETASQEIRIMAEINGVLVGFGSIIPEKSELRSCYVHSKYAGKGIGSKIVGELEKISLDNGVKELVFDASLNAKIFYEKNGYIAVEKVKHSSRRSGRLVDCYKMKKTIYSI